MCNKELVSSCYINDNNLTDTTTYNYYLVMYGANKIIMLLERLC